MPIPNPENRPNQSGDYMPNGQLISMKNTNPSSTHEALVHEIESQQDKYPDGFEVAVLPTLMPRSDNGNVFIEGKNFSGYEQEGPAQASITCIAVPHIMPIVKPGDFEVSARKVLGEAAAMPDALREADAISPQLIVWWRAEGFKNEGRADLMTLAKMPEELRQNFFKVIGQQTLKATQIISDAANKPVIWGSWGFATPEERRKSGLGRGVSTNKHGHLHVTDFSTRGKETELSDESTNQEKLDHLKPWSNIFNRITAVPISRELDAMYNSHDDIIAQVTPLSQIVSKPDGTQLTNYDGYNVDFIEPVSYERCLDLLSQTASHYEVFYQDVLNEVGSYYKNYRLDVVGGKNHVKLQIAMLAKTHGFTNKEAINVANLALGVPPTRGQLQNWFNDIRKDPSATVSARRLQADIAKYKTIDEQLGKRKDEMSLLKIMKKNTVAHPKDGAQGTTVWSHHASASYMFRDYDITEDGIMVNSMTIVPGIDSNEAAPQFITGNALRRNNG